MAVTTLTIGGSSVNTNQYALGRMTAYVKDGIPTLSIYRRGGALPGLPDPWIGKQVVLNLSGVTKFQGDVVSGHPSFQEDIGWIVAYQCLGLRYRGNLVPFTDDNTGLDTATFNNQPEDPSYIASRAGQTVGQILSAVLTMPTNATNLNNVGIGNYSGMPTTPTLPSTTVADLAAMTVIVPTPVYIGGQKLIGALDSFLAQWAPNHTLWVDPANGTLRFLDQRLFGGTGYNTTGAFTFTLGTDPVFPCPISRDATECFQRVEVRGQPWIEPMLLSLSNGGLAEVWSNTDQTNWKPSNFIQPGVGGQVGAADSGSINTATETTTTVQVTSDSTTRTWITNYWDQTATGHHGIINLAYTSGGGAITQYVTRRIVANTALAAAGTSTLTLDIPLPITLYNKYTIFGTEGGLANVWRLYETTNPLIGAALQNYFPYPVAYVGAGGTSASLTSVPVGSVLWSATHAAPYNQFPMPFTQTPGSGSGQGQFLFVAPTINATGGLAPEPSVNFSRDQTGSGSGFTTISGQPGYGDVQVLAAVATGANHAFAPANIGGSAPGTPPSTPGFSEGFPVYSGTSNTVEGLTRTLVVTVDQWRDPGQVTQMAAFAADVLDSVKDSIVEGEITVLIPGGTQLATYTPFLTMGMSVAVTGTGYTTGWENTSSLTSFSRGLQVVMAELEWNFRGAVPWTLRLRCSNRRAHNTASTFLKPARTGATWGGFEGFDIAAAAQSIGVGQAWQGFLGPMAGGAEAALGAMGVGVSTGLGAMAVPTSAESVAARSAEEAGLLTGGMAPPPAVSRGPQTPEERTRLEQAREKDREERRKEGERRGLPTPTRSTMQAWRLNDLRRREMERRREQRKKEARDRFEMGRYRQSQAAATGGGFVPREDAFDQPFGPEERPRGPLTGGPTARERAGFPPLQPMTGVERAFEEPFAPPISRGPLTGGPTSVERAFEEPFGPGGPGPVGFPEGPAPESAPTPPPVAAPTPPPLSEPTPPPLVAPPPAPAEPSLESRMSPFARWFTAPGRAIMNAREPYRPSKLQRSRAEGDITPPFELPGPGRMSPWSQAFTAPGRALLGAGQWLGRQFRGGD